MWTGPLVPDVDVMLLQILDIGVTSQEPEQLVEDCSSVELLGRNEREAVTQVEAHLMAEDAERTGAGTVLAQHTF